jgi:hypothetical protein
MKDKITAFPVPKTTDLQQQATKVNSLVFTSLKAFLQD